MRCQFLWVLYFVASGFKERSNKQHKPGSLHTFTFSKPVRFNGRFSSDINELRIEQVRLVVSQEVEQIARPVMECVSYIVVYMRVMYICFAPPPLSLFHPRPTF